jgi:hypothetical protein
LHNASDWSAPSAAEFACAKGISRLRHSDALGLRRPDPAVMIAPQS